MNVVRYFQLLEQYQKAKLTSKRDLSLLRLNVSKVVNTDNY